MRLSSSWIVSLSVRLYQWLLNMGPVEFRNEYGDPTVQVFRECCHDAYQQRGIWGVISLWPSMFADVIIGMLTERFSALQHLPERHTPHVTIAFSMHERMIPMPGTLRRSMTAIFCAFVLFGLAWLFFSHMPDPSSYWDPIVRLYPEVDITYQVIVLSGEIAFLMILLGGFPILASTIKQAFIAKRRDVLLLFGLAAFMLLLFIVEVILTISWQWWHSIDPNGGIFAILFLVVLLVVTVAVSRAVVRSEPSQRVLRLALVPATVVTVAMAVALVATFVEAVLLSMDTPQAFSGTVTPDWVIADLMMVVSICIALVALWRGLRARTPTPA